MVKVLFSQVSVCPHPGGTPVPGSLPGPFQGVPQSQVLSQVTGPRSFLGGIPWQGQDGVSPSQDFGPPPPLGQNGRARTCYAVGSMPLAFTQDDFFFRSTFVQRRPKKHLWKIAPESYTLHVLDIIFY